MGGVLLSLGGMVALMIGGGIGPINAVNPGLTKLISAAVFPVSRTSLRLHGLIPRNFQILGRLPIVVLTIVCGR